MIGRLSGLVWRRLAVLGLPAFGIWVAALWPGPAAAQAPARPADIELSGQITRADHQTYLRIPFKVPAGIDRLAVRFDYDGREDKTVIDLGVEDPHGLRGASGGNKAGFTIAVTDATPSYLAGPILPGRWHLALAVPNIRPGVVSHWKARIWLLRGAAAQVLPAPTEGRGPGWYRGDLHLHTAHSDGSCVSQSGQRVPCPLVRTLQAAAEAKLDFIALTEHNTASQANDLAELQPYFDRLLLIPGREITTFYGHFNVFGVTSPLDFRIGQGGSAQFNALADRVHALGGLVSINHPNLPSDERCMGCGWTMPGADLARVDAVEVINGGTLAQVPLPLQEQVSGIAFWLSQQARGLAPTAVGGSDNHDPARAGAGAVGDPVTVVWARDLSQAAVLAGVRAGRVFVVLRSADPALRLDFAVEGGSRTAVMGEALDLPRGTETTLRPDVVAPDGIRITLFDGAERVQDLVRSVDGRQNPVTLQLGPGRHNVRLALYRNDGSLLAVGNAVRVTLR